MAKKDEANVAAAAVEANVKEAVDKWFADNFHNTAVSRDVAVHNLIHEAKPALVKAVVAAVEQANPKE